MSLPGVRRILIIEDCLEDALLLGLAFEDQAPDVHVQAVSDGESGLACCESAEPPQLVVLDLHLPGETSWDLLTRLRRLAPLPVVCWSSHAHPMEVEAALTHGAVAYLEKPREGAGFEQIVHRLLAL